MGGSEQSLSQWQQLIKNSLEKKKTVDSDLTGDFICFFENVFNHTVYPEKAWFGIKPSSIRLVIGGIFLASVLFTGKDQDKGIWLLVDPSVNKIRGLNYLPVKSTKRSKTPLLWIHGWPLKTIRNYFEISNLWQSYSSASEKVIHASSHGSDRDTIQKKQGKTRLTDFWQLNSLPTIEKMVVTKELECFNEPIFDPASIQDAREKVSTSIVRRRGQPEFRAKLLQVYGGRCAVTGTDAEYALEAAHIIPYKGAATNHLSNGLLLRADIHTLFDLGLIAIDTETMTIIISPKLANTSYRELRGKVLLLPVDRSQAPSTEALNHHRQMAGL